LRTSYEKEIHDQYEFFWHIEGKFTWGKGPKTIQGDMMNQEMLQEEEPFPQRKGYLTLVIPTTFWEAACINTNQAL
jgi:hypothetical protein